MKDIAVSVNMCCPVLLREIRGGGAKKFTVAMARPTICPIGGLDVLFSNVPHTLCSLSGINLPSLYNKYNPSPSYLSASLYIMRDLSTGLSIDRVIF